MDKEVTKSKKKKKKKSPEKKRSDKLKFNSEYHNLITIFIGIFLFYSLNTSSTGMLPVMIQNLFKGLFGAISNIIPFLCVIIGVIGFFDGNEYINRIRKTKIYYIAVFFVFIFYGLTNSRTLPIDSPLSRNMINEVVEMGVKGTGTGLVSSTIAFYMIKIFGRFGSWLVTLFLVLILAMYVFNISLKDLIGKFKKNDGSENMNLKDKIKGMKDSAIELITDEVDETTQMKKTGFFKKLFSKGDKALEDTVDDNTKINIDDVLYDEQNDLNDDNTIKIVGFNKSDDDYLEILEATSNMPELEILKNLQNGDKGLEGVNNLLKGANNFNGANDISTNKDNNKSLKDNNKSLNNIKNSDINDDEMLFANGSQNSFVNYKKPPIDLLNKLPKKVDENRKKAVAKNAALLEKTLSDFGVEAKINLVTVGPTITRYEVQPKPGVKVSKIVNLTDDIALSLAAKSIRIEAPIPGKSAIGIEVPNEKAQIVTAREIIESEEFMNFKSPLAMGLGKDVAGKIMIADISKMPHLLIAGATGSGKSVCINTLISSILYKANPDEVKLVLIDPKVVELANYNNIPHLLVPVVTEPKKAANALNWAVIEMNKRYKLFAENQVKDITSYNDKARQQSLEVLPKIVIIIDELADLMMASGAKDVEDYICRLAQMARAAGMHLIVATQRPSVDVITGVIKANIPSRIAFAVSSQTDSRTILDMGGAEKLLGKGDMLFYPIGSAKPKRIQGAFISEEESERVIDFVKAQVNQEVHYENDVIETISKISTKKDENEDEFLPEAIKLVVESEHASASMLQRRFKIGFNRAARLIESMEERGIVGPSEGSKPRKVLVTKEELEN